MQKTMFCSLIYVVIIISSGRAEHFAANFSVIDHGAAGDGITLDTKAIQATIDKCAKEGGGTVYIPSGKYLTGTIFLKSRVALYLDSGATLLGSTDLDDYPVTICAYRSYTDNYTERSLIYAEQAENISILGRGTIDGQGAAFKGRRTQENPYKLRPYLIRMIQCKDVAVKDVTIIDSPMWVQHYLACDDVLIDGITVHSFVAGNNDGIDIDSCHGVRIANCEIYSGDDAIVLKATSDRMCKDVVVTNCVLSTHCNAFKLGTESNGGFQNITFNNSTVYDTRLAAIALEMVDGGILERVSVSNININGAGTAIFCRLGNRARPFLAKGPGGSKGDWERKPVLTRPGVGSYRMVVISNIQAINVGQTGCSIAGIPGHPVEEITLENIRIKFKGGGSAELVSRDIPEKEEAYPEHSMFGVLPAYGFFVRHVQDLRLESVDMEFDEADERPAFVFDDVSDLEVIDINGEILDTTPMFIWMKNVSGAFIYGSRLTNKIGTFIQADNCKNLSIMNNVFTNVENVIAGNSDTPPEEIFIKNNRE